MQETFLKAVEWLAAACGNAQVCAALGDVQSSKIIYTFLEPSADRYFAGPTHTPTAARSRSTRHARGDRGRLAAGPDPPQRRADRRAGHRLAASADRKRSGDAHTADRHFDATLRITRRTGMALVAEGMSNRQIATRLHLSERTVETTSRTSLPSLPSRARIVAWWVSRAQ